MMANITYRIQYHKVDKKTGKMANANVSTDIIEAPSEPSAVAKLKAKHKDFNINIASVTFRN